MNVQAVSLNRPVEQGANKIDPTAEFTVLPRIRRFFHKHKHKYEHSDVLSIFLVSKKSHATVCCFCHVDRFHHFTVYNPKCMHISGIKSVAATCLRCRTVGATSMCEPVQLLAFLVARKIRFWFGYCIFVAYYVAYLLFARWLQFDAI